MSLAFTELRFTPTASEVRYKSLAIKQNVPAHHGIPHDNSVVRFGTYLALREGANAQNVQIGAFLHDIRWWDSEERRARKIDPQANGDAFPSAAQILEEFHRRQGISDFDHEEILEAVVKHNKLPSADPDPRSLATRCLGDADRLSRFGVGGLLSILETNEDYGVPFYNSGSEIVRPIDAPMIPFNAIDSCVVDIQSCNDWTSIMETGSGKELAWTIALVNREFLETFSLHPELGYKTWIPWLRSLEAGQVRDYLAAEVLLNEKKLNDFRATLIRAEDPNLVSQDAFERFIKPA